LLPTSIKENPVKSIRNRLSYANVMSSIAVFLVLGGATAFAATKIGSNQLKANAVLTGKIKKEAVTTAKIKNGAVTTSKIADNAVTGAKVLDGSLTGPDINLNTLGTVPSATNAANAQPTSFAHVSAAGVIDTANSKNAGTVTKVGTSVYCFSGLPFAPRGGQATVDFNDSLFEFAQFGLGAKGGCPAGTQAFVFTVEGATAKVAGFFVLFYG
jgi:hypothetical protein